MKCFHTPPPHGYQQLHQALVLLDSFVIPLVGAVVGALFLCTSKGISNLVFDATAMGFICSINMQIAGLMSWSLSGHGGRAFQPANVSIKDSENSTQHAHYSFVASAVVATVCTAAFLGSSLPVNTGSTLGGALREGANVTTYLFGKVR